MSLIITRKRAAIDDIIDAAYHIAEDNLDASIRFLMAIDDAIADLADMPLMGTPRDFGRESLKGVRTWPVPGFRKHYIIYRATDKYLDILRVMHQAQNITVAFEGDETEQ